MWIFSKENLDVNKGILHMLKISEDNREALFMTIKYTKKKFPS